MSNVLEFELVQPSEFDEYYYRVLDGNYVMCYIEFSDDEWVLCGLVNSIGVTIIGLSKISNKINELNAATKADKLFGFL